MLLSSCKLGKHLKGRRSGQLHSMAVREPFPARQLAILGMLLPLDNAKTRLLIMPSPQHFVDLLSPSHSRPS